MQLINSSANATAYSSTSQTVKGTAATFSSGIASDSLRPLDRVNTHKPPTNRTSVDSIHSDEKSKKSDFNQTKQSFELDESKLAIIENHQASNPSLETSNFQFNEGSKAYSQADQKNYKEQIPSQNQTAVSTYAMVNNLAQRESVQKV